MWARHIGALVIIGVVLGAWVGCTSPTLPLPPPLSPSITAGPDADHVVLTASCNVSEVNAVIVVINDTPGVPPDKAVSGALTNDCGGWDTVTYAHSGDVLDITYQLNGQISLPTTVGIP